MFVFLLSWTRKSLKRNGSKLFCLGGVEDPSGVFLVQDFSAKNKIKIPNLPIKVINHSSTCFNKTVYCLGGNDQTTKIGAITNKVLQLRLNSKPLKWKQFASINENRWLTDVVVYQNMLVVVGGGNGQQAFFSGECFVKVMNKWQAISNLNCARFGYQLVVCDNCLYALGELKFSSTLSSVERLSGLADNGNIVSL